MGRIGWDGRGKKREGEEGGRLARSKYQLGDPKVGQVGWVVSCDLLCSCGYTMDGSFDQLLALVILI